MSKRVKSSGRDSVEKRQRVPLVGVWHFAATIFLGAFLLFQVQPIISRMILPWFGGGTSIWTTCMLFFQAMLVAGYAYVHGLVKIRSRRVQMWIHLSLLLVACFLLPITPGEEWQPPDASQPTMRILVLLLASVGLPYFLLSTTGPMVQWWFVQAAPGASPYRLFSLSNVGSLLALLSYPFAFERLFPLAQQGFIWSAGFVGYAALAGALAWRVGRADLGGDATSGQAVKPSQQVDGADSEIDPENGKELNAPASNRGLLGVWMALAAFGSVVLLAMTNAICQDIAVMPFLWIAPLSLYLLSFILCFEHDRWYSRRWASSMAMVAVLLIATSHLTKMHANIGAFGAVSGFFEQVSIQLIIHLSATFLLCMVCHGELALRKPGPKHLTSYYLAISVGGALGGAFVGIVCPAVFSYFVEFSLVILAGFVMSFAVFRIHFWRAWSAKTRGARLAGSVVGVAGLVLVCWSQYGRSRPDDLLQLRNFYGVIRLRNEVVVADRHQLLMKCLVHGNTVHGAQYQIDQLRGMPTTYYTSASGVGILLENYGVDSTEGINIGVVGLGVGTVAAYGTPLDTFRFFEINPDVVEAAESHFTFLEDCRSQIEIVEGDARLTMGKQEDAGLDILILDAFSGDAIPTHLLTEEAFELYLKKLKPGGVICVHVTNRYIDLTPVVVRMAMHYDKRALYFESAGDDNPAGDYSQWIWVTGNASLAASQPVAEAGVALEIYQGPLWTDQYCSIVSLLLD